MQTSVLLIILFFSASEFDLSSQKAYVLASKGLLKPRTITDPIILELKLLSFNPPDFTIGK